MPSFDEVLSALKALNRGDSLMTRREVRALPEILWAGELPVDVLDGIYENRIGLLLATNRRVLFVEKSLLGKLTVEDFPYDKISSIQFEKGILMGSVKIMTSGNSAEIKNCFKDHVAGFAEKVRARLSDQKPERLPIDPVGDDFIAKLERLAKLKADGHISDDEFTQAKQKLIG